MAISKKQSNLVTVLIMAAWIWTILERIIAQFDSNANVLSLLLYFYEYRIFQKKGTQEKIFVLTTSKDAVINFMGNVLVTLRKMLVHYSLNYIILNYAGFKQCGFTK